MDLRRLGNGERIAGVSAILLFVLMFFHWFGVKAVNTSNLLFAIQSVLPGQNAWEALDYTPTVLLITILATLAVAALRLTNSLRKDSLPVNAVVAILGFVSVLLILYRIVNPPVFNVEPTVTFEGAVQFPIFLALAAAAGIALGGFLGMRDEGVSIFNPRGGASASILAIALVPLIGPSSGMSLGGAALGDATHDSRGVPELTSSGGRRHGSPMRWHVLSPPWSRKVRIGRSVGWCPGTDEDHLNPPPKIQRVRQVERGRKVILTAFLIHRAGRGCLGVETMVERVVTLRHKLRGRLLYDGSVSPPAKRWPTKNEPGRV